MSIITQRVPYYAMVSNFEITQLANLEASYNIEKQYKIITFAPIKKNQSDRRMQMREKAIILGSR